MKPGQNFTRCKHRANTIQSLKTILGTVPPPKHKIQCTCKVAERVQIASGASSVRFDDKDYALVFEGTRAWESNHPACTVYRLQMQREGEELFGTEALLVPRPSSSATPTSLTSRPSKAMCCTGLWG